MSAAAINDLVLVPEVDEGHVLSTLEERFRQSRIYTYIGHVLLSVNPFKPIGGLYGPSQIKRYLGRYHYENPPHVYATAESAYRNLVQTHTPQCVLVSGESGSGKTEAAKRLMEYIAAVAAEGGGQHTRGKKGRGAAAAGGGLLHGGVDVAMVKDRLLQSNPLLETFGNAKTLRNDNSSRFGKFMEIVFSYGGAPIGGKCTNYLLEKPRVTGQGQAGERSYHAFYQLLAARRAGEPLLGGELAALLPADLHGEAGVGCDPSRFSYLANTACYDVRGVDDLAEFRVTGVSMDSIGLAPEEQAGVWRLVAAVLALGCVRFEDNGAGLAQVAEGGGGAETLGRAAGLLGVPETTLRNGLTMRTVRAAGRLSAAPTPLTVAQATATRDALAKALYSRNFSGLVRRLNAALQPAAGVDALPIGVLDIYGFEIFEQNSFEQLCINYCNEKLQQVFIELTLKTEQEEYEREGVGWEPVAYFDNKVVVDLIDATRPAGVLALLNEECIVPQGSDGSLLKKLDKSLGGRPHYSAHADSRAGLFVVQHYAGDVTYSVEGLLDKNRDTLHNDLLELGAASAAPLIAQLFAAEAESKRHSVKRAPSAGSQFKAQMAELIAVIGARQSHYIRCIKSNEAKKGMVWQPDLVANQARYLGLLENVKVRRAGYAYRTTFESFVRRFKMVSSSTWPQGTGNARQDVGIILAELGIGGDQHQMGKTKVFVRRPQSLFLLEEMRTRKLPGIVATIQRCWRQFLARRFFLELRQQAQGIFEGRKRRCGSVHLHFVGDYLGVTDSFALPNAILKANPDDVNPTYLFADSVMKINRAGKEQQRYLVITKRAFYFTTPTLQKTVVRSVSTLASLNKVVLSTMADNYVVLHYELRDFVFRSPRKAEIVTLLKQQFAETGAGGRAARASRADAGAEAELPLEFADRIHYKTQGVGLFKSKALLHYTLEFAEDTAGAAPAGETAARFDKSKRVLSVAVSRQLCSLAPLQLDAGFVSVKSARRMSNGMQVPWPLAAGGAGGAGGVGGAGHGHGNAYGNVNLAPPVAPAPPAKPAFVF
eukprot:g4213.t1